MHQSERVTYICYAEELHACEPHAFPDITVYQFNFWQIEFKIIYLIIFLLDFLLEFRILNNRSLEIRQINGGNSPFIVYSYCRLSIIYIEWIKSSFSHHMDKTKKSLNSSHETAFSHLSVDLTILVKDVCDKNMSSFSSTFRWLDAVWVAFHFYHFDFVTEKKYIL